MALYKYRALNEKGLIVCGVITALSRSGAREQLRMQPLDLLSLGRHFHWGPTKESTALFFLYLAYALEAGHPLLEALNIVHKGFHGLFGAIVGQLHTHLGQGLLLSQGCAQYGLWFSPTTVALIQVGEQSGQLPRLCQKIHKYLSRQGQQNDSILKAFAYPVITFFAFLVMVVFLIYHLVPSVADLFQQHNVKTPWMIKVFQVFYSHPVLGAIGVFTPPSILFFGPWRKRLLFSLFGRWMAVTYYYPFFASLEVLVEEKISLTMAMELAQKNITNPSIKGGISLMVQDILQGKPLSAALGRLSYWPTFYSHLLCIGHSTGHQMQALKVLVDIMGIDQQRFIDRLIIFTPPILLIIVGLLICLFVQGTFFPLYRLMGGFSHGI